MIMRLEVYIQVKDSRKMSFDVFVQIGFFLHLYLSLFAQWPYFSSRAHVFCLFVFTFVSLLLLGQHLYIQTHFYVSFLFV